MCSPITPEKAPAHSLTGRRSMPDGDHHGGAKGDHAHGERADGRYQVRGGQAEANDVAAPSSSETDDQRREADGGEPHDLTSAMPGRRRQAPLSLGSRFPHLHPPRVHGLIGAPAIVKFVRRCIQAEQAR